MWDVLDAPYLENPGSCSLSGLYLVSAKGLRFDLACGILSERFIIPAPQDLRKDSSWIWRGPGIGNLESYV